MRILGFREAAKPSLLRRLSGAEQVIAPWALLGAGSLGSKLAAHAARAGHAPAIVADSADLTPHNAARHVLFPEEGLIGPSFIGPKAERLAEALKPFAGDIRGLKGDHRDLAHAVAAVKKPLRPRRRTVNATASLESARVGSAGATLRRRLL